MDKDRSGTPGRSLQKTCTLLTSIVLLLLQANIFIGGRGGCFACLGQTDPSCSNADTTKHQDERLPARLEPSVPQPVKKNKKQKGGPRIGPQHVGQKGKLKGQKFAMGDSPCT